MENYINIFLSIYLYGIIAFAIHLYFLPRALWTTPKLIELFLLYQIVFSLGLTSLIAFIGLTFLDKFVATYTQWPHCPFEQQMGNVNLAFAVLGFLSIWYRGYFWMATIIGFSVWILSDGIHHVYEAIVNRNFSEGNVGFPLYTDFAIPIILLILLFFYMKSNNIGLSGSRENK